MAGDVREDRRGRRALDYHVPLDAHLVEDVLRWLRAGLSAQLQVRTSQERTTWKVSNHGRMLLHV